MTKQLTRARVFALKDFTIKTEDGKFFIAPTGRNKWAGPYKELASRNHGDRPQAVA